jgi:hypothetical protein
MKDLEYYTEYIQYLDWRLLNNQINKGKHSLLKISKSSYNSFIKRLEIDETFNEKIITIIKAENRDKKIDKIIKTEDIEVNVIDEKISQDESFKKNR